MTAALIAFLSCLGDGQIVLGGVSLGKTTTRQLAKRLGKPEVFVGAHANSRFVWSFKNDGSLTVDGFKSSPKREGYIIDTIHVSHWKGTIGDFCKRHKLLPAARWLRPLACGMGQRDLARILSVPLSTFGDRVSDQFNFPSGNRTEFLVFWNAERKLEAVQVRLR